jgi:hypothetical protein
MSLNVAQMDWVLANYAADNPKDFKFIPASEAETHDLAMTLNVSWADVLVGKAREEFMAKWKPKNLQGARKFTKPPSVQKSR